MPQALLKCYDWFWDRFYSFQFPLLICCRIIASQFRCLDIHPPLDKVLRRQTARMSKQVQRTSRNDHSRMSQGGSISTGVLATTEKKVQFTSKNTEGVPALGKKAQLFSPAVASEKTNSNMNDSTKTIPRRSSAQRVWQELFALFTLCCHIFLSLQKKYKKIYRRLASQQLQYNFLSLGGMRWTSSLFRSGYSSGCLVYWLFALVSFC